MSVSGTIRDEDKSAGYWFKLGAIPFLMMILIYTVTLFIFNTASQLVGAQDAEAYGRLSEWYMQLAVFSFAVIGIIIAFEREDRYRSVVFNDPNRTWKDFASVIIAATMGMGFFALMREGLPFEQVIKVPEVILQLIIASTEELAFRLALPALIYIALHKSKINLNAFTAFLIAIILANMAFASFHYASYLLTQEGYMAILSSPAVTSAGSYPWGFVGKVAGYTAQQLNEMQIIVNTPLEATLFSAFIFGMLQSIAFVIAIRASGSGGEWALLGIIGGHYIWNLEVSNKGDYNSWQYLGVYLMTVFLIMFAIGYFFTPKRKNTMKKNIRGRKRIFGLRNPLYSVRKRIY